MLFALILCLTLCSNMIGHVSSVDYCRVGNFEKFILLHIKNFLHYFFYYFLFRAGCMDRINRQGIMLNQ